MEKGRGTRHIVKQPDNRIRTSVFGRGGLEEICGQTWQDQNNFPSNAGTEDVLRSSKPKDSPPKSQIQTANRHLSHCCTRCSVRGEGSTSIYLLKTLGKYPMNDLNTQGTHL